MLLTRNISSARIILLPTVLLDRSNQWLNEGFSFLWSQLVLPSNTWSRFCRKSYSFARNFAKISLIFLLLILYWITNYTRLVPENNCFFILLFQIKQSWVILISIKILISKGSPETVLKGGIFKILDEKLMKYRLNVFSCMLKIWVKKVFLL